MAQVGARFATNSRSRLTHRDLGRFPSDSLFDKVGRAVCQAGCLPRKELYESWEVARRIRRRVRGGVVWDMAAGHGLLGHLLLLLDSSSPRAYAVDPQTPPSASLLTAALASQWPRLGGLVQRVEAAMHTVQPEAGDLVVSAHACGSLTDDTIDVALRSRADLAVLPCCHEHRDADLGGLGSWMDASLAMDAARAARLRHAGYRVLGQQIPKEVTPKNRLLLAWLERAPAAG